MATLKIAILAAVCLAAHAFPHDPLPFRNTIFGDEKLEGGPFENIDAFDDVTQLARSNLSPYRLPTTTKPEHYDILWTVEFPRRVFSGKVDIQLYATQAGVNEIVIHSSQLNNLSHELKRGNTVIRSTLTEQTEYHFLRIRLADGALEYGSGNNKVIYTLTITFEAPLRKDMYGIYESWYRNSATDNAVSWMASTQFQATSARNAFPCYDEPSFKATFTITIRRPTAFTSWTGMRLKETRPSSYQDDEFYITPIVSTYLLAILVAEYETNAVYNSQGDLMYEVIARPGAMRANQSDYAFDIGQDLLAKMSEHTAMDFYSVHPYVKMTQAAIPDFSAGAMENWGLLTYREAYLMYDEDHSTSNSKQLIAYILSHEIAHMWFGNLVTCEWWDTLWLNEGFARYYQYFLTDWVDSDLGLGVRFINEQVHAALLSDSSNNPQPLTNPGVASPSAVSNMFSTISYNKGAAIIRQTEHLLGFDVHRQGLRNYLVNRAFDVAEPIHLFEALQQAAVAAGAITEYGPEFNFIDYYRSWTEQGGHPVLNVEVDHQTGEMTIYQRRFNINSGYSTASTNWIVPISFATASNPDFTNTKPSHIISEAITKIDRGSVGDEWVIFNKQQTGYYRVNYDDYTWDLIVMALRGPARTQIHPYNRAQIVNDVFQFARSGLMSYNRAFNILSFLENETDYNPWVAAITGFNWIRNRLVGTTYLARLETLMAQWATRVMTQLTYRPIPNESFMQSYLRYQLAPFMCNLNQAPCRQAALEQFQALRSGTEVPVDSRNWVYCNALRQGTTQDFDFLWERFLNHNVYNEKILLLQTLGCTPHEASLNKYDTNALVEDNYIIRRQDYTNTFSVAVSGNEANTQTVFRYIQNNLEKVGAAFGTLLNPTNYWTPLSYIAPRLRNAQQIQEFQSWATNNREVLGSNYNSIYNSVESTRESIKWAADVQSDFESYLNSGNAAYQTSTPTTVATSASSAATPPPLVEPVTPELPVPDSASTAMLSVAVIAVAAAANFVW
ncbi:hypothetical protein ABMA27_001068 [Loxostege sticticalis]|uniref:Aminopeptidase n=1 Tax=Loxostege sticticalis TaxID=481309 RepID=A0ABR3I1N2_LOXSC